jgi:transcriptional regulator with XRE-family HTH domain
MTKYNSDRVLDVVKQALKKKNITYSALGERLEMSESGIKKVMTGEDVSLERLAQICEAAELDLMAVFDAAWKAPPASFEFTPEQVAFFGQHPAYYDFLIALLGCSLDAREVARRYQLDEPSVVRYLGKLEDLGLLAVFPEGKIKCAIPAPYRTRGFGDNDTKRFLDAALAQPSDRRNIAMAGVRMTKDHLEALRTALRDLIIEYGVKAHQDELTRPDSELIDVTILGAIARCRHEDFVKIPRLPRART